MRGPLRDLRRCPEFCERVRQYLAVYRAKLAVEGLALKSNRIALLMRRAAIVRGVVRARGKHPPCQQYLAACRWPDGSIVRASNEYLFSIETGEKKLLVD